MLTTLLEVDELAVLFLNRFFSPASWELQQFLLALLNYSFFIRFKKFLLFQKNDNGSTIRCSCSTAFLKIPLEKTFFKQKAPLSHPNQSPQLVGLLHMFRIHPVSLKYNFCVFSISGLPNVWKRPFWSSAQQSNAIPFFLKINQNNVCNFGHLQFVEHRK